MYLLFSFVIFFLNMITWNISMYKWEIQTKSLPQKHIFGINIKIKWFCLCHTKRDNKMGFFFNISEVVISVLLFLISKLWCKLSKAVSPIVFDTHVQ